MVSRFASCEMGPVEKIVGDLNTKVTEAGCCPGHRGMPMSRVLRVSQSRDFSGLRLWSQAKGILAILT